MCNPYTTTTGNVNQQNDEEFPSQLPRLWAPGAPGRWLTGHWPVAQAWDVAGLWTWAVNLWGGSKAGPPNGWFIRGNPIKMDVFQFKNWDISLDLT